MNLTLQWLADALNAKLTGVSSDHNTLVTGASIDSRTLREGELFVALPGEHVDGHEFVAQAKAQGASGALVARPVEVDLPQILCMDVLDSLTQAAASWRAALDLQLVGVTGSCGKTTVKNLLASILSQVAPCAVTAGNYNNEIGVPLTLLGLNSDHRFAVVEMGASRPGDIAYLANIAKPDIAIVTNAAAAHLEFFGSLQKVAETKGELFAGLPEHGTAVINDDDEFADLWRSLAGGRKQVTFGSAAQVSGTRGPDQLHIVSPRGEFECSFALPGRHNLNNALAACAAACALDIDVSAMAAGLAAAVPTVGRLTRHQMRGDWILIDDSYNANPASLAAAIDVLVSGPGQAWLVLGDMGELGPNAEAIHFACGRQASDKGVDRLFSLGPLSAHAAQAFGDNASRHQSHAELSEKLRAQLIPQVQVLVKGSRSARMEQVVQSLLQDPGAMEEAA